MPSKNQVLLEGIENYELLKTKDITDTRRVLDVLLRADRSNGNAFRQAVATEAAWLPNIAPSINQDGRWGTIIRASYLESDEFLDPADVNYSFEKMHRKAAGSRVKLGLKDCDETVLLGILTNNGPKLRGYIAGKPALGNFGHGFPNGWDANNGNVLDDPALLEIQKEAAIQLMNKLILKGEKAAVVNLLTELRRDPMVPDSARSAAVALGFPQDKFDSLLQGNFRLNAELIATGVRAEQKFKFAEHVGTFPKSEIVHADMLLRLQAPDPQHFKAYVQGAPINANLDIADIAWAKGVLGARYLVDAIPTSTFANRALVMGAINKTTSAEVITELKNVNALGNHSYINQAVSDDNLGAVKRSLMLNFIANDPAVTQAHLENLLKAKTPDQVTDALSDLGVARPVGSSGFIKSPDKDVEQAIRTRIFKFELDKCSPFGGHAKHAKLIEYFNSLPPEKQQALIADGSKHKVRLLIDAKDKKQFDSITRASSPVDDTVFQDIAAENKQVAALRSIHNSEVAKALSDLNINITPRMAREINEKLDQSAPPTDLNNVVNYQTLITNIKNICHPSNENAFYNRFYLNNGGVGLINNNLNTPSVKVREQFAFNANIYDALARTYNISSEGKIIMGVLLSIEKERAISAADFTTAPTSPDIPVALIQALSTSSNRDLFLAKFNDPLRKALNDRITPNDFEILKFHAQKLDTSNATANAEAALKKAVEEHDKFYNHLNETVIPKANAITDDTYSNIDGISQKEKDKLQKELTTLSDFCAIAVNQITDNLVRLKDAKSRVPANNKALHEKLDKEFEQAKKDLNNFKDADKIFTKALEKIDKASVKEGFYEPQAAGLVKREVVTRAQVETYATALTFDPNLVAPAVHVTTATDKLKYTEIDQPTDKVEWVGIYKSKPTATAPDATELTASYSVDSTGSRPKVKAHKLPDKPEDDPEQSVKIAMVMAREALELYNKIHGDNGPPSSKRPIVLRASGSNPIHTQLMYLALLEFGANNPDYKFDKSAIKVDSDSFRPDNINNKWTPGYRDDSLYHKVFHPKDKGTRDKTEAAIKDSVEKFTDGVLAKRNQKEEREIVETDLAEKNKGIKTDMKDIVKEASKRIEETGKRGDLSAEQADRISKGLGS